MDISKLSYTVQKKTDMILELKGKKDKKHNLVMLLAGVFCLLLFYVIFYNDRYISYVTASFQNLNIESSLKRFDLGVLLVQVAIIIVLYIFFDKLKKDKDNYEDLRKDLIKTINNEFCICKNICTCKDDYIKYMEEKDVNLIFYKYYN